jgi:hypothetical protein
MYIERRSLQNERKGSRDEDEEDVDEVMNGFIPHHSDLCVCEQNKRGGFCSFLAQKYKKDQKIKSRLTLAQKQERARGKSANITLDYIST